jgi:lipoprotein-anchoring transpeptidase ErfK/SrfK
MLNKLLTAICSLVFTLGIASIWIPKAAAAGGVVSDDWVNVRFTPSTSADIITTLYRGQYVDVVATATGEDIGGNNVWDQLPSGGWVNSSFVLPASASDQTGADNRWIDVDISTQTARAMVGDVATYTADVTTGKQGFQTPTGTFRVLRQVRHAVMDSLAEGIPHDAPEGYYFPNVLYTQYFTSSGVAIHANDWQPDSVFGNTPTSHGCVGMRTADAAFFWDFADVGTPVIIHY